MTDEKKPRLAPGYISLREAYGRVTVPITFNTFYSLCSLRLVPGSAKIVNRLCVHEAEYEAAFMTRGTRSEGWLLDGLAERAKRRRER